MRWGPSSSSEVCRRLRLARIAGGTLGSVARSSA